jgi:hypothetical protein
MLLLLSPQATPRLLWQLLLLLSRVLLSQLNRFDTTMLLRRWFSTPFKHHG